MKRCPTCNETFDEGWLSFCTHDGTTLVDESYAPGEPLPTILAQPPESPLANEQATWSLPAGDQVEPPAPAWPQPVSPAWQPPPPPTYAQPESKGLAIASMIVGILSILCLGPIPAIFAIVLGSMSLSQIKKDPQRVGGAPMAWTGIITGGAAVLLYGVLIVLYIILLAANV
jgi:uncharacterized protein DUF4190